MASTVRFVAACLASLATLSSATSTPIPDQIDFGPSEAAARQNAFDIFNAVHSAMRQWGSSLNHNGMSVFLVTIPAGVLLHHGTHTPHPPPGPEWLAFEIEHAELFAHPRRQGNTPPPSRPPPPPLPAAQNPMHDAVLVTGYQPPNDDTNHPHGGGYLHTYQTTHPLSLLYLDGSSAAKTTMGTLDTQDLLLRLNRSAGLMDERGRARDLCEMATSWGLHGVLRMEAGFEVIKCGGDFGEGMELLAANRRPDMVDGMVGEPGLGMFEVVRAVARRYGGIGGGRVVVDWGSMVSVLLYGVTLTNPDDAGGELPRLVGVGDEELRVIRGGVAEVVRERRGGGKRIVDWQGVVDLIVARYADRLRYMVERAESIEMMQGEIGGLLNTHIDFAAKDEGHVAAVGRCTRLYTLSSSPETVEDRLILTAIETVTHNICSALFEVRKMVMEDSDANVDSVGLAKQVLRRLMDRLRWTTWKECVACGFDEGNKKQRTGVDEQKQCVSRESNAGPIDGNDGFYH
ncbi:hypothetical protein C8A00DRAFT_41758 [Chaetomidium leptoderma]|uniref:Uncharacterized protein n=1 Tax=Chaetomidium leptoderma TaxID=669021 RepID=A0AAN6ZYN0_9PEZI|nr:hypothetical protein C8A00DRAFT_41758 [Chaetomidium leptoderma]